MTVTLNDTRRMMPRGVFNFINTKAHPVDAPECIQAWLGKYSCVTESEKTGQLVWTKFGLRVRDDVLKHGRILQSKLN